MEQEATYGVISTFSLFGLADKKAESVAKRKLKEDFPWGGNRIHDR